MVFRFKVEKKVNTVVPAVKLGCFVVHLGGLKTLPKQGYVIGLFAILYCYLRSLIGQFVINRPAAVSSFSGTGILDQQFVCLTPKSTQIYQIDTICHQTLCQENRESRREGIDVLFIVLVVEVATRIQGPDLMFVQKLKYSK